ncbi:MAG: hypothetical protein KJ936_04305, partial [Proteobacteria bacterium]|nr:hypothetical protein [Pseudomonadota bacterium]
MSEKKEMQVQDLSAKVLKPERTNLAPTANGAKIHAWESIRLLLACQQANERIVQICVKRTEHKQRREDSHRAVGKASEVIRRLGEEFDVIRREEQAKDSETAGFRSRLEQLEHELVLTSSNRRYREISQEIERCRQKVEQLEAVELEILERKEAKEREFAGAKKFLDELRQRFDQEGQRIAKALEDLNAEEQHEGERLQGLKSEFCAEDEWLQHFERLVNGGKVNAVVEIVQETCPGCHLRICTSLRQEARTLDHMVRCENRDCGRIIYSTSGATIHCLTVGDLSQGRLPLPLQCAVWGVQSVRIRDIWGNWHEVRAAGDWLTGLERLFAAHALSPGERVKLVKAGNSEDVLRFEPEMVSRQELDQLVNRVRSSAEPVALDAIVAELLETKARVYRLKLLSFKVRSELEKLEGIYFSGDLVWHSPLWELPKPSVIPLLPPRHPRPPIAVSLLPSETTVTLTEDAIGAGEFRISPAFQGRFDGASSGDTVTIKHGVSEAFVVDFDVTAKALKGVALQKWYHFNALEAGDRVTLAVRDAEHRVFHIHTTWKRDFRRLLEQRRKGAAGFAGRPRDLLYGLLVEANQALHYRDLWSRAAEL